MERIQKRIHQLELGEEIAAKDIKALLSAEQQQKLVDAPASGCSGGTCSRGVCEELILLVTLNFESNWPPRG